MWPIRFYYYFVLCMQYMSFLFNNRSPYSLYDSISPTALCQFMDVLDMSDLKWLQQSAKWDCGCHREYGLQDKLTTWQEPVNVSIEDRQLSQCNTGAIIWWSEYRRNGNKQGIFIILAQWRIYHQYRCRTTYAKLSWGRKHEIILSQTSSAMQSQVSLNGRIISQL